MSNNVLSCGEENCPCREYDKYACTKTSFIHDCGCMASRLSDGIWTWLRTECTKAHDLQEARIAVLNWEGAVDAKRAQIRSVEENLAKLRTECDRLNRARLALVKLVHATEAVRSATKTKKPSAAGNGEDATVS